MAGQGSFGPSHAQDARHILDDAVGQTDHDVIDAASAVSAKAEARARIDAKTEGRDIRDGEIRTACEAACPADAIVFGDLNKPDSRVSKLKAQERNYGILEDLGTRPRTSYLAVVRNPNPALEKK